MKFTKRLWFLCVLLLLLGGSVFGWFNYNIDNMDCSKNQIIIDLKHRLNKDNTKYKENSDLDEVLSQSEVLKVSYDGKKFHGSSNADYELALLNFLNKRVKLNSNKPFTFYIFIHDIPKLPKWHFDIKNTPILMVDMDIDTYSRGKQFLVPDFYLIRKGYETVAKKVRDKSDGMSFKDKKDIVFWRGAQTGGIYNYDTKEQLPRYNLVMFSLNNPSYVDARFVSHKISVEDSESGKKYIEHMNSLFGNDPEKYATKVKDHVQYKYLISLDGFVSAWERPVKIMNGRSVLLYHSNYVQFFTPYMQEGKHYVGVKEDLSDLKAKVDWLRSNPKEAEFIANKGRAFAEQLTPKLFACYYREVLEHIQKHFVLN